MVQIQASNVAKKLVFFLFSFGITKCFEKTLSYEKLYAVFTCEPSKKSYFT